MIREVDFANEDYRGLARALALGAVRGPYTSYSGDGTAELNIGEVAAEVLGSEWFAAKLAEVERAAAEKAWEEGVATALNHAKRGSDGITLKLVTIGGDAWVNPYRATDR